MKKFRPARRQRRAAQLAQRKRLKKQARRKILPDDRRGSVIIVVITLLTALMVIGFFVFTMARQEKENAEYFKQASKRLVPLDFDPDTVFDCFLHDFILGPPPDHYQSPLWGGHMSLLPTMYGTDIQPFNGEGVNAVWNNVVSGVPQANGFPQSDMNYDGSAELSVVVDTDNDYLMQLNQSPAAQGAPYDQYGNADLRQRPQMDVDYTYPDHNNPFLTYIGVIRRHDGTVRTEPFVLPAFHRPQLLRNLPGDSTNGPVTPGNFLSHSSTASRVLVPHQEHRIVLTEDDPITGLPAGTVTGEFRFVSPAHLDPAGILQPFDGHSGVDESFWGSGATLNSNLAYPVDPTGKGVPNAFYLDCGFGLQEDPTTGETYVPLIAVTVLDAESLINLNIHGNTSRGIDSSVSITNGAGMSGEMLNKSHQGVSRSEINPTWAMNAVPALSGAGGDFTGTQTDLESALEQYRFYYGNYPAVSPYDPLDGGALPRFRHMANMELWNLLHGRPQFDSTVAVGSPAPQSDIQEVHLGRWGEEGVLLNAIPDDTVSPRVARAFPWAGASGADDNRDSRRSLAYNANSFFPSFQYVMVGDLHPVDFFGVGNFQQNVTTRRFLQRANYNYPAYASYFTVGGATGNRYRALVPPAVDGTGLVGLGANAPAGVPLVNEPEEMLVEPMLAEFSSNDRFFDAAQNALLQLSRLDLIANGTTGRVLNLAPFNFFANDRAEQIRSRFTSLSSEALTHQTPAKLTGLDPNTGQPLAPGAWQRGAAANFDSRMRTWEYFNQAGGFVFPPVFPNAPGGPSYIPATNGPGTPVAATATTDPFRNELRELLFFSAFDDQSFPRLMRRLELNKVLDRTAPNGPLRFRPLTPHPSNPGSGVIGNPFGGSPYPVPENITSGNARQQEFLARYDRQRLARDIFVLLYTFGGGQNNVNYTTAATPYGDADDPVSQVRRMAQFAVNFVDYFDPDDVTTVFEFDAYLADGWEVNDNPYEDPQTESMTPQERGVVYGQEEQTLCINEAFAVFAQKVLDGSGNGSDHRWTEWIDVTSKQFAFVELENVSSRPVNFDNRGAWRVVTRLTDAAYGEETRLLLKSGSVATGQTNGTRFTIGSSNTDTLNPSGDFPEIGMNNRDSSRLRIRQTDTATDPDAFPLAPANNSDNMDFDLKKLNAGADFELEDANNNPVPTPEKNMLKLNVGALETAGSITSKVEFVLQRRAHPSRARVADTDEFDNPWVVVDRFQTDLQTLALEDDDMKSDMALETEMSNVLPLLKSLERSQPLFGKPAAPNIGQLPANQFTALPNRYNTIGRINTRTADPGVTKPFTLWQPHFNRQFASEAEVFNVPLYGPQPLGVASDPNYKMNYNATYLPELTFNLGGDNSPDTAKPVDVNTFGYFALYPDNLTPADPTDDNRWYRILEYLKLETRQDSQALWGSTPTVKPSPYVTNLGRSGDNADDVIFRDHGPINLNMLRHPEVLAALLDDPVMFHLDSIQGPLSELYDRNADAGRPEWYTSLALARDRNDPVLGVANTAGVPVPGIPGISRPFRSLANVANGVNSARGLENTMLRRLVYFQGAAGGDYLVPSGRQLFEIGNENQHNNGALDYALKHKLLGKVLNHGTTLSNTFFVFMQVDLFSARDVAPAGGAPQVRIGAKLPNSPGWRSFCVIDRGLALDLVRPSDLPPLTDPNTNKQVFSFNQNFNWRALVVHRQRLN
jgi:hypothetical protein